MIARDGVENAVEYFTKNPNGKQYIQDLIKQSDEPEVRRILEKNQNLKNGYKLLITILQDYKEILQEKLEEETEEYLKDKLEK